MLDLTSLGVDSTTDLFCKGEQLHKSNLFFCTKLRLYELILHLHIEEDFTSILFFLKDVF